MPESKTNETKNVSATKGVAGGYFFAAPVGTTLPADCKSELGEAFKCLGFISEDGYAESIETESNKLVDMNGDTMDETQSSRTESATVTMAEIKAATLKAMYGDSNVTDADGMIVVRHNADSHPVFVYVLELLLKDGRKWRKVVPQGKSSELDTLTLASGELAGRALTLTYLSSSDYDGDTCRDFIESTETSAA